MTGWLLIFSLLILGGVLSTLGDRLGSRVGKARLSVFNLRPRSTAVLITVLTGSLISAVSFGFMLLVSRQLRVGLFELSDLELRLKSSREALKISRLAQVKKDEDMKKTELELGRVRRRIISGEKELKELESNLIALRSGNVVISSGQPLATATLRLQKPEQAKSVIDRLLQQANSEAFSLVRPGEKANRQILLVPKNDIKLLEKVIRQEGTWVVNFRSAANVLLGENVVYGFPEVRPNIKVVEKGEVLATTITKANERNSSSVRNRLKLLLASALAEAKRRGSLATGLRYDSNSLNELGQVIMERSDDIVQLEAIALRNSKTADPLYVRLKLVEKKQKKRFR